MLTFDQQAVASALPHAELVDVLADAFLRGATAPSRSVHTVPVRGDADATLLLMPAWKTGDLLGVKIATVFPGNVARGLDSVQASYLLLDASSGTPLAMLDGTELTLRRTAAASALASRYLSKESAATLLMVGTGKLAPHMIAAHAAVRPIRRVLLWGRRRFKAEELAGKSVPPGLAVDVVDSLEAAVGLADIICCATMSCEPLILGCWLQPGQHIDLVGAYTAGMREADSDAVLRARVFVDSFDGALAEAGEIIQSLQAGVIRRDDILADLPMLVRGSHGGRARPEDITMFKSVGMALEDLAAAGHVLRQAA